MRTRLGWALTALGALFAIAGLVVMVVLGPDSRFSTGSHAVDTDGIAVVTAPKVISWAGVRIDVLAEVPVQKPVFVGLGNTVDVENYLAKTRRLEVTNFRVPWTVHTRQVDGKPNLPGAPTAIDWWLVESAGLGGASISTTLPDQSVSVAILAVGSTNLSGLQVTFAYGIKGGFYQGLGLVLFGLGVVRLGVLMRRDSGTWQDEDENQDEDEGETIEEVVYVYVDQDGVEHELSAEEARGYEILDEQTQELWVEPEPEPEPEPQPTAEDVEQVVYVFVDEDGIEHEVSADELADWEIVDEED